MADPRFDRDEARRMRAAGLTYERIGDELGVHISTIYRALNPKSQEAWTAKRKERRRTRAEPVVALRDAARRARVAKHEAAREMAADQHALVVSRNRVAHAREKLRVAEEYARAIEARIKERGGSVDSNYPHWCSGCNSWVVPRQIGRLGAMCSKEVCRSGRVRPAVASEVEDARIALQRPLDAAQVREELEA